MWWWICSTKHLCQWNFTVPFLEDGFDLCCFNSPMITLFFFKQQKNHSAVVSWLLPWINWTRTHLFNDWGDKKSQSLSALMTMRVEWFYSVLRMKSGSTWNSQPKASALTCTHSHPVPWGTVSTETHTEHHAVCYVVMCFLILCPSHKIIQISSHLTKVERNNHIIWVIIMNNFMGHTNPICHLLITIVTGCMVALFGLYLIYCKRKCSFSKTPNKKLTQLNTLTPGRCSIQPQTN